MNDPLHRAGWKPLLAGLASFVAHKPLDAFHNETRLLGPCHRNRGKKNQTDVA
jgi:hypothetical protein